MPGGTPPANYEEGSGPVAPPCSCQFAIKPRKADCTTVGWTVTASPSPRNQNIWNPKIKGKTTIQSGEETGGAGEKRTLLLLGLPAR